MTRKEDDRVEDHESISPKHAIEIWLNHLRTERSELTIQSYEYRLERFLEWCSDNGIDDLTQLTSCVVDDEMDLMTDG